MRFLKMFAFIPALAMAQYHASPLSFEGSCLLNNQSIGTFYVNESYQSKNINFTASDGKAYTVLAQFVTGPTPGRYNAFLNFNLASGVASGSTSGAIDVIEGTAVLLTDQVTPYDQLVCRGSVN